MGRNLVIKILLFLLFIGFSYTEVNAEVIDGKRQDLLGFMTKEKGSSLKSNRGYNKTNEQRLTIPLDTIPYWLSRSESLSLHGVSLADINNDGYPEVITIYEQGYNYLYLNNGGIIDTMPYWQSSDWDFHVWPAFGDYDNDGDLDMAVASYSLQSGRTKLYSNNNGMLTRDPVWIASYSGGTWCGWGDVDNDGDLDLAVTDMFAYPCVFRNNNGVLETTPFWTATDYNIDFGGAWIDVDGDGDLDLAVTGINWQEPVLRIYYNNNGNLEANASWSSQLDPNVYSSAMLSVGDIDKDGWLDVASPMGVVENNQNCVYRNINGMLEQIPSWFSTGVFPSCAAVLGDIDGDGFLDLVVNNTDPYATIYHNDDGSLDTNFAWHSISQKGEFGIDLGDVDQDGVMYREDTLTADGTKKLFYLSILPIQQITEITVNGNSVSISDYCCDLKSGWVSFKDSIPTGSQIIFKYYYSIDMELLLCDHQNGKASLFRNTNAGVNEKVSLSPKEMRFKVYPNPFTTSTTITLSSFESRVQSPELNIYDVAGREVRHFSLLPFNFSLTTTVVWDGKDNDGRKVPAGVYFCRLGYGKVTTTKEVLFIK